MKQKSGSAIYGMVLSGIIVITGFGLVAKAQSKQTTDANGYVTTKEPSGEYGDGGTHETTSDKQYRPIQEIYRDKCGRIREVQYPREKLTRYYDENGAESVHETHGLYYQYDADDNVHPLKDKEGKALVEKLKKTPSAPCPEKTAIAPKEGQKERPKKGAELNLPETVPVAPKNPTPPPRPEPAPTPDREVVNEQGDEFSVFGGFSYMHAPSEFRFSEDPRGFGFQAFWAHHAKGLPTVFKNHASAGSSKGSSKFSLGVGGELTGVFGSTSTGATNNSLPRYLYVFGPRFIFYPNKKVDIFIHPLFGVVHDTGTSTIGTTTTTASATAFAMAFGGGVDVRVSKHLAIRLFQMDYVPTHFGGQWQNNFQFSMGIVLRFGKRKGRAVCRQRVDKRQLLGAIPPNKEREARRVLDDE